MVFFLRILHTFSYNESYKTGFSDGYSTVYIQEGSRITVTTDKLFGMNLFCSSIKRHDN